jgi:mRNA interferase YafQ
MACEDTADMFKKTGYLMLTPVYTRQLEKDIKRMQKRGKNVEKLKSIIRSLIDEEPLDALHRDHKLIGSWRGRRDCHVGSNWLLGYELEGKRIIFERTGTHSDLFRR